MSEDSSKPKAKLLPWHPIAGIFLIIALYFLAPIVGSIFIGIGIELGNWSSEGTAIQFAFILLVEAITVAVLLWFLRLHKSSLKDIGLDKPKPRHVAIGVAVYPLYFISFAVIAALAIYLFPSLNVEQEQQLGFNNVAGIVALIMTFISLVILPPIVEELTVRGMLFTSLRSRLSLVWATMLTSLIFAAAHLPEGGEEGLLYIAAIDTFALSLILCVVREKTKSLWPCITLHALKNGIAYVSLFIVPLL